jgi:hypothetical protein
MLKIKIVRLWKYLVETTIKIYNVFSQYGPRSLELTLTLKDDFMLLFPGIQTPCQQGTFLFTVFIYI